MLLNLCFDSGTLGEIGKKGVGQKAYEDAFVVPPAESATEIIDFVLAPQQEQQVLNSANSRIQT